MKNSIPKISPMAPESDMDVLVHTKAKVTAVTCNGEAIAFTACPEGISFTAKAALFESAPAAYEMVFEA
jgi:hypothetical protein